MKLNTWAPLVAAVLCSTAFAQNAATNGTPATPFGQKPAVVPAAASAAVSANNLPVKGPGPVALSLLEANPFTGKNMTVEQIQQKLEEAKLTTLTLEEMLKQTNLTQELTNVPLRKAVEAAQARTSVKKEEVAQQSLAKELKAPAGASKGTAAEGSKTTTGTSSKGRNSKKTNATPEKQVGPAQVEPPRPAKPVLLSVLNVAGSRSAVLDFGGATLVVADGDMTPVGTIKVLDASSVSLNGEKFTVRTNTLSRFVVSDPRVDPDARKGSTRAAANNTPAVTGSAPSGVPSAAAQLPPLPGTLPLTGVPPGPKVTTPPLQMPPGVSFMPTPR